MTEPVVTLNEDLAQLAELVAASRGERLEDVVERLLREYVSSGGEIVQLG